MKRSKIGHNAPCPCGSGKKYKHCCLLKDRSDRRSLHISFLDDEIFEAGMLSAEHNEKSIVEGIERLRRLLNRPDLNPTQRLNVKLSLARAYQRRGEHHAAIEMLS
ncbi:MAG: SEC-C metal-binding domain-containing protein, partial [Promethearchaeota archaeon]